jgi:NADH-quinone oxidoreductase subunit I
MKRLKQEISFLDKFYIFPILRGMWVTIKHFFSFKTVTIEYPEIRTEVAPGYRGLHRQNLDEEGRLKCVACEMCAAACPSKCIKIIPAQSPYDESNKERYPVKFEINELRCIYCGFCEEACPEDAIELTKIYDMTSYTREEMIYDLDKLIDVYQKTKDDPNPFAVRKKSRY